MSTLSHLTTDPYASDADLNTIAADIQTLHEVARSQSVDVARFARLERSLSFRLESIACFIASLDAPRQCTQIRRINNDSWRNNY